MDKIILKNMAFYGYHGNLDSEKSQGQRFYVDVEIKTDLTKPGQTDVLEDSINYVEVYDMVASIMTLRTYRSIDCRYIVSTLSRYYRP